eukprot:5400484-Amphidinium_carterae.1
MQLVDFVNHTVASFQHTVAQRHRNTPPPSAFHEILRVSILHFMCFFKSVACTMLGVTRKYQSMRDSLKDSVGCISSQGVSKRWRHTLGKKLVSWPLKGLKFCSDNCRH